MSGCGKRETESRHGWGWQKILAGVLMGAVSLGLPTFGYLGDAHAEQPPPACGDSQVLPTRAIVPADVDAFTVRTYGTYYDISVPSILRVQRLLEDETREDIGTTVTNWDSGHVLTLGSPLVEGERYVVTHPACTAPWGPGFHYDGGTEEPPPGAQLETIYEVGPSLGTPESVPAPTIRLVEELTDASTRHYLDIRLDTEGLEPWYQLMELFIAVDGESVASTRRDLSARTSTEILVDCGEGDGLAEGTYAFNALLQSYGGTLSTAGEALSFEIDCENAELDDRRGSALPGTPDGGTGTSTPPSDSSAGCSAMPMAGSGSGLGALALFALGLMRRRRR